MKLLIILMTFYARYCFVTYTSGRHVKLTGANENAAKYTGIKTKKVVIIAYILSGLGGGLGGSFLAAYFGSRTCWIWEAKQYYQSLQQSC